MVLSQIVIDTQVKEGCVIRTEPAAGQPLKEGATVTLYISGKSTAVVPHVVGLTWAEAEKKLRDAGFAAVIRQDAVSAQPVGTVVSQSEDAYTRLDVTTRIVLFVSVGTPSSP